MHEMRPLCFVVTRLGACLVQLHFALVSLLLHRISLSSTTWTKMVSAGVLQKHASDGQWHLYAFKYSADQGDPNSVPSQDRIRERAYELYENRGCEPGQDEQDWLCAERELLKQE